MLNNEQMTVTGFPFSSLVNDPTYFFPCLAMVLEVFWTIVKPVLSILYILLGHQSVLQVQSDVYRVATASLLVSAIAVRQRLCSSASPLVTWSGHFLLAPDRVLSPDGHISCRHGQPSCISSSNLSAAAFISCSARNVKRPSLVGTRVCSKFGRTYIWRTQNT